MKYFLRIQQASLILLSSFHYQCHHCHPRCFVEAFPAHHHNRHRPFLGGGWIHVIVQSLQQHRNCCRFTGATQSMTTSSFSVSATTSSSALATAATSLSVPDDENAASNEQQQQCKNDDTATVTTTDSSSSNKWIPDDPKHRKEAQDELNIWPLDVYNAALLNEVHPRDYEAQQVVPHAIYDLIAIGAGAGGLVSSKQSARRGAKSAMISAHLAGGDCLNVGCVPSKALLRVAKAIREVKRSSEFGVRIPSSADIEIDFPAIMRRMRQLRTVISPADGHTGTTNTGAHVFQGYGTFTSPNTIQVSGTTIELKFRKAVIATGGRPLVPQDILGLVEAPYTTNEILFNLETLPPRMVILGAGIIALEMAQCFATFGSNVTVIQRSKTLFASTHGDVEAAQIMQQELEDSGVQFIRGTTTGVTTLRERNMNNTSQHPLMSVLVETNSGQNFSLECECLLVATGRLPNVENLGLEEAGVKYEIGKGVIVNDNAQSVSNPNIYAVGDCVAGVPRLTHMSGEMAKLVVQNSLFHDDWKLSSLVVPAVMYTEPEYATVGITSMEIATKHGIAIDTYRAGLEHNDRAILESSNRGFCKVFCRSGTEEIVGAVIVAERAGEIINEITLAMKNNIGLRAIGRNIHPYPTTGEAVMGCGIQYINANWERLD